MIDGEFISLGPHKPFQALKHHNLLSVLRLGSGQLFKDPNSYAYGAAFLELVQSYIITI